MKTLHAAVAATLLMTSGLRTDATETLTGSEADAPAEAQAMTDSAARTPAKKEPPVVHSATGDRSAGVEGSLLIVNTGKKQQYSYALKESFDPDITSPKSATFSADGKRFYINSLEGCRTAVYDAATLEKIAVITYSFPSGRGELWGEPSGHYPFRHYPDGESKGFQGKPVESTWSHGGRYLWVPFYRRTFDLNAQDPSAIAVINATTHRIVRMMETGPLPKMVATSHDGTLLAVTHWGDNTVGFIDISSDDPMEWRHFAPVAAGYKFNPDYSLTEPVNRDSKSGYLLRGTVFTPDDRYLLVSGMAGPLSVFDARTRRYLGAVRSLSGIRHLAINGDWLYGSKNMDASVIRLPLSALTEAIGQAVERGSRDIQLPVAVARCKVGGGARTLEVSPDGKYLFVACNSGSAIYVVDAGSMKVADSIRSDSYPVGLALSPDGSMMVSTSQGRSRQGGNAVNIYRVERYDLPTAAAAAEAPAGPQDAAGEDEAGEETEDDNGEDEGAGNSTAGTILMGSAAIILAGCGLAYIGRQITSRYK